MRKFVFRALVCLFVVAAIARGQSQNEQSGNEEDSGYSQISIFAKAVQLLRQDYVDENKTSYHDLILSRRWRTRPPRARVFSPVIRF